MIPLVELGAVSVCFGDSTALSNIHLAIPAGARIGIAGRSGSGKSTLARLLTLHLEPSSGARLVFGQALSSKSASAWRRARRSLQLVIQDPASSFVPRWTVAQILQESQLSHRDAPALDARSLLAQVRLPASCLHSPPHALSGGERCRLALARALAVSPSLLVLDETLSSLDGPVRREITDLLADLQRKSGLALVSIAHDLRLLRSLADHWLILHQGRLVESGPAEQLIREPRSPHTAALLHASFLRMHVQ